MQRPIGGLYMLVKHPWVRAGIALGFLLLFALLAPRIYRALRAECTAFGALLRHWFGETRTAQLRPEEQRWLEEHGKGQVAHQLFTVIAAGGLKGFRNRVGVLCFAGQEAVFFTRKWGRLAAREIGPVTAIEIEDELLVDSLVLAGADGLRREFDLLAGQLERALEERKRLSAARAEATR